MVMCSHLQNRKYLMLKRMRTFRSNKLTDYHIISQKRVKMGKNRSCDAEMRVENPLVKRSIRRHARAHRGPFRVQVQSARAHELTTPKAARPSQPSLAGAGRSSVVWASVAHEADGIFSGRLAGEAGHRDSQYLVGP